MPPCLSGPSTPVFDAVMVGCEVVANAPLNRLGAASDVNLAIDRSDVGLHGIRAEVGESCHLGIAVALCDQRQDLRFALGEPLASSWPVQPADAARPNGWIADHHLAGVDRFERRDEIARW